MVRPIRCLAVATFAFAVAPLAVAEDTVIDAHLKAIGGPEALAKIETLQRSGKAELKGDFGQFEGTFREAVVNGKKSYTTMDLGVFMSASAFDGEKGWSNDPQQGLRDIEGDDLRNLKLQMGIDPIASVKAQQGAEALQVVGDQELDGVTYDAVKIADTDVTFFLDKETKLISAMQVKANDPNLGGDYLITATYDGYKDVEGVKLHHANEIDIADGLVTITLTYDDANIVNQPIEDALFAKPAQP